MRYYCHRSFKNCTWQPGSILFLGSLTMFKDILHIHNLISSGFGVHCEVLIQVKTTRSARSPMGSCVASFTVKFLNLESDTSFVRIFCQNSLPLLLVQACLRDKEETTRTGNMLCSSDWAFLRCLGNSRDSDSL